MSIQSTAPGPVAAAARARRRVPWHRAWWFEALLFVVFAAGLLGFVVQGAQGMGYQWKWDQVPRYLVRVIDGEKELEGVEAEAGWKPL